ncbi:hypothetical protein LC612_33080 [Nostoc sp. CHAB 5834]|nr:hypothetical protein [Nostoc sp. CHAB 5834]
MLFEVVARLPRAGAAPVRVFLSTREAAEAAVEELQTYFPPGRVSMTELELHDTCPTLYTYRADIYFNQPDLEVVTKLPYPHVSQVSPLRPELQKGLPNVWARGKSPEDAKAAVRLRFEEAKRLGFVDKANKVAMTLVVFDKLNGPVARKPFRAPSVYGSQTVSTNLRM